RIVARCQPGHDVSDLRRLRSTPIGPAQIFFYRAVAAQETIMSSTRQTASPSSSTTQRESRRGTGACAAAGPAISHTSKSDKRWPAQQAADVAIELGRILKPLCSRIVIAGSLRRHKPFVGDIEL